MFCTRSDAGRTALTVLHFDKPLRGKRAIAMTSTTNTTVRRRSPARKHITATVDPDLLAWLDDLATEAGISRSQAINSLLRRVKNAEDQTDFRAFPNLVPAKR